MRKKTTPDADPKRDPQFVAAVKKLLATPPQPREAPKAEKPKSGRRKKATGASRAS